jgi:hypothetical protein
LSLTGLDTFDIAGAIRTSLPRFLESVEAEQCKVWQLESDINQQGI